MHEEKAPSFTVRPSKGLCHCLGCGVAGDVIGFITKQDKVNIRDALDILAKRAGLDLQKEMEVRPSSRPPPTRRGLACPLEPKAVVFPPAVVDRCHRTFCEREDARLRP